MDAEFRKELIAAGVDIDGTMDRFMNNEALFEKFIFKFLDDDNYEKMMVAKGNNQVEEAFNAAHTLKGVTGNLGINCIYKVSIPLVEILRKSTFEGSEIYFEQMETSYQNIISVLNKYKKQD